MLHTSTRWKKLLLISVIALLIGGSVALYQFNKPHRDPSQEQAVEQVSADELKEEFVLDATAALEKYLDKVIAVKGNATEISDEAWVLSDAVYCLFDAKEDGSIGSDVIVKGRVVSYDDLFEQVRLDFCTLQP